MSPREVPTSAASETGGPVSACPSGEGKHSRVCCVQSPWGP
ncbi:hypothetical protein DB31_0332 [Hyalangium minutum]|uniref:Uncharacterized protein n=1 Tax=Hyalangium minutum TaxID=394096 RepID=A0A085WWK8_9BACT|nr:hypothetical protein DB31_0332 [Hyalangium minutum]